MVSKINELEALQNKEGFWDDLKKAGEINKQLAGCKNKYEEYNSLVKALEDLTVLIDLAEEENEDALAEEIENELKILSDKAEDMKIKTLLKGKYDNCNAILTLHAGAGGTEAQDWVSMLYRMYTMYAEKMGYKVKLIDLLDGDEAGIKSVTFELEGDNAYGYMKAEKGVHRLVRISPFDANSRRHTSFASLDVMPEIENDSEIEINSEDLKIDTYRSGGAGGQHVNKTESAVRITHLPTGIIVQCQNERSQIQNRETAMKMLRGKLIEKKEREQLEQAQDIKGELKKIEWGSQIRSYVFHPYNLVKDHRTGCENTDTTAVMNGDIHRFITEYLKRI